MHYRYARWESDPICACMGCSVSSTIAYLLFIACVELSYFVYRYCLHHYMKGQGAFSFSLWIVYSGLSFLIMSSTCQKLPQTQKRIISILLYWIRKHQFKLNFVWKQSTNWRFTHTRANGYNCGSVTVISTYLSICVPLHVTPPSDITLTWPNHNSKTN